MGGRHASRPSKSVSRRSTGELRYADEGEMYARCKDKLGTGRFLLQLSDGSEIVGKVVGALYKRAWINKQDLVLVSARPIPGPNGNAMYDVVHKYSQDEERILSKYGELRGWKMLDCSDSDSEDLVDFEEVDDI